MRDILAEYFDKFNPEEQARIRAAEVAARGITAQGQSVGREPGVNIHKPEGQMVRGYLVNADVTVRSAMGKLRSGSKTLEQVAGELEVEARIWGGNLHCALLNDLALDGVAPEEFEAWAGESAKEIAVMAATTFSVQCGRGAATRHTPLLIGQHPEVIDTDHAIDIDTRTAIRNYLEKALAEFPDQYRRQNLSVNKLTRGTRGGAGGTADTAGVSRMPAEGAAAATLDRRPVSPEVEIAPGEFGSVRKSPKEFVDVARRNSKLRSYDKFAARIGIGKDTLYAITKENRWVSAETYVLVSQVCSCEPHDLHPRDIPPPSPRS